MKLNEIYDENEKNRIRDLAMKGFAKDAQQYQKQRAQDAQERPARAAANQEYQQKSQQVRDAVIEIGKKYGANQLDAFRQEVESSLSPELLAWYGPLDWDLEHFNRDAQQQTGDEWAAYGKARQEKDPSIVGRGPGGGRNWTGD